MEVDNVIKIEKGTPLSEVVGEINPERYVGKSVYKFGDGIYFYLTKFRVGNFWLDHSGPFLSGVFCAPDDGAIKRAVASDVEEDTGVLLFPPVWFLPNGVEPEYEKILTELKRMNSKVCQESASYRIARDGNFVHRLIETEKYAFYFRGLDDNRHEPPYAILYKY